MNKQIRAMDAPASAKVSCLVVSKEVMPHAYSARVYLLQVASPNKNKILQLKKVTNSYRLLKSKAFRTQMLPYPLFTAKFNGEGGI